MYVCRPWTRGLRSAWRCCRLSGLPLSRFLGVGLFGSAFRATFCLAFRSLRAAFRATFCLAFSWLLSRASIIACWLLVGPSRCSRGDIGGPDTLGLRKEGSRRPGLARPGGGLRKLSSSSWEAVRYHSGFAYASAAVGLTLPPRWGPPSWVCSGWGEFGARGTTATESTNGLKTWGSRGAGAIYGPPSRRRHPLRV